MLCYSELQYVFCNESVTKQYTCKHKLIKSSTLKLSSKQCEYLIDKIPYLTDLFIVTHVLIFEIMRDGLVGASTWLLKSI